jgi:hypothetical protein
MLNIADDVRLPPQCVGAGLLAKAGCQARTRSDALTPSRASALLQWIYGAHWTCGVHMIWTDAKFVGAGLLAKAGCQARTRSDVLTPSRASALLQWIYGTHWTCGVHIIWTDAKFVGDPPSSRRRAVAQQTGDASSFVRARGAETVARTGVLAPE